MDIKDLLFLLIILVLFYKTFSLHRKFIFQRKYFIDTLSHDLRVSLLAQLRGLDLLKKDLLKGEDYYEMITNLNESSKFTLEMITMLLNSYRFDSGEVVLNYEKFNISELINEIIKSFSSVAEERMLTFEFDASDAVLLTADKFAISKVLVNLIMTALANSNKNSFVKIKSYIKENAAIVSLTYVGKPLTDEEYCRMFEQKSNFSTVGHGIRMNFVKKIIDFHKGKITVSKSANNINSFTFQIPLNLKNEKLKSPTRSVLQPLMLLKKISVL